MTDIFHTISQKIPPVGRPLLVRTSDENVVCAILQPDGELAVLYPKGGHDYRKPAYVVEWSLAVPEQDIQHAEVEE